MRGCRRDACILACGGEPLVGDGRRVVAVDQVVRDAGMIGILPEFAFQDGSGLQRGRVSLVGWRLRAGEIERVEDLRFVVGRILLRECLVRLGARNSPFSLRTRREVLVVGGHRLDVVAFALGLRADAACLVDRRLRLVRALRRCALSGHRIVHEDLSDSPRGDRAFWIFDEHVAERLLAGRKPERVQHRHRALERGLHLRIAARRERHLAQRTGLRIRLVRLRDAVHGKGYSECKVRQAKFHGDLPDGAKESTTLHPGVPIAQDARRERSRPPAARWIGGVTNRRMRSAS